MPLKQKLLRGDGKFPKIFGREIYGSPFRASGFHVRAVVVKVEAEEYVSIVAEMKYLAAIEIDINIFKLVSKYKNGCVFLTQLLCPS